MILELVLIYIAIWPLWNDLLIDQIILSKKSINTKFISLSLNWNYRWICFKIRGNFHFSIYYNFHNSKMTNNFSQAIQDKFMKDLENVDLGDDSGDESSLGDSFYQN